MCLTQIGKTAKPVPSLGASSPTHGVSFFICIWFKSFNEILSSNQKKKKKKQKKRIFPIIKAQEIISLTKFKFHHPFIVS